MRDGCDPRDHFLRVAERGDRLVRVELAVAPDVTEEERFDWLARFIDGPLGTLDGPRAEVMLGARTRGGC